VLPDKAALLRIGKDGAERATQFAHHGWRAGLAQRVLEPAHHGNGQLRELDRADERDDVQRDVLSVSLDRGRFEIGGFAAFKPEPSAFRDHDALTVGDVNSGADIDANRRLESFGVLLTIKRLDAALAVLPGVGDDPRLAVRAVAVAPCAFAD